MSNARAVHALLMEMSMLPIQAPSMRTCAMRFPPASTTAMFIGCFCACASFSAAAMTRRASASVTIRAPPGQIDVRSTRNGDDHVGPLADGNAVRHLQGTRRHNADAVRAAVGDVQRRPV